MPEVPVNLLAVLACAVSSMIIGTLWYGPLFGKSWMQMMGFTKGTMDEAQKKGMMKSYALMFIGSLVMAFVMTHSLVFAATYLNISGVNAGLQAGVWNWLGFVAPVTMGSVLWEGKPWKLWVLNNGYNLVSLCVMGVILSLWQ